MDDFIKFAKNLSLINIYKTIGFYIILITLYLIASKESFLQFKGFEKYPLMKKARLLILKLYYIQNLPEAPPWWTLLRKYSLFGSLEGRKIPFRAHLFD